MLEPNEDRDRQMVPRWRSFDAAMHFGELKSVSESSFPSARQEAICEVLEDWNRTPGLSVACDLLSVAFTAGITKDDSGAAKYVMSHPYAPAAAKEIASRFMEASFDTANRRFSEQYPDPQFEDLNREIANVRKRLNQYPINPVLWTNLALFYTTLGIDEKAVRAIRIALELAPDNRFVTRSACRLFVHLGDIEQSHAIMLKSPALKADPWILSAEVAMAAIQRHSSRFVRTARRMIESRNHSSFHLSELASALATVEARSGAMRKARQLCELSLVEPAENSIAQAAWLRRNTGLAIPTTEFPYPVKSSEAEAWKAVNAYDWIPALAEAKNWQRQQPFSSRPAILAGNIASTILEDFSDAESILRRAFISNRDDATIANNLAFSLARQGNSVEAGEILAKIDPKLCTDLQRTCITATAGLVYFRGNEPENGRFLYKKAAELAEKLGLNELHAAAKVYLAVEEIRIGTTEAELARCQAMAAVKSMKEPFASIYRSKVDEAHRAVATWVDRKRSDEV